MTSHYRLRTTQSRFIALLLAATAFSAALPPSLARAADEAIYAPGEPIVTGFSGTLEPESPPPGSDPLDYTFIDPDGPSMVIQNLQPDSPPAGQLVPADQVFAATAADIGQVFGVTLDNAPELEEAAAPNIYLSATSAFGLNIVVPDADGNPVRSKTGAPDAAFIAGQWGTAGDVTGYPGSIWKVDGTTGEISLFSTIAANSGASLGDLVYDPGTDQFFVSDLDTGLIYRLDVDGVIVDTFDHGVTARPEHELDPVEDDGTALDITDPTFNTEDTSTWGFTQPERRVFAVATRGGRLFYSSGLSIWSVRIESDGSFGAARWELDATGLPSENEITDIAFDPQGRMLLAQRGPQVASYDYTAFAEAGTSSVVRYEREFPADPSTPSTWVEEPDRYAIGFAEDGTSASGGIALGPKYNAETDAFDGACSAYLWATGDSLRLNPDLDPALAPPFEVSGLQGNSRALVLPQNAPPYLSVFADYDGNTEDDQSANQGHVGGVAIWQQCESVEEYVAPPALPPVFDDDDDEDFDDEDEGEVNLTLEKWAKPYFCFEGAANWHCSFTIRVENTGDEPYFGPVAIDDYLPDNNPGAVMDFWPQPPWHCNPTGPTSAQCVTGPVLLYPGDGIVLHETVTLPKALVDYCELPNVAGLNWFWDDDDDPSDDFNAGVAGIKAPGCFPGSGSDLSLKKVTFPTTCADAGADWACSYVVMVQNTGPDNYSGPITVTDTLGINAPATTFGPWACAQAGPVLTCNILAAPVNVPPGWSSGFLVTAKVPKDPANPNPLCNLDNRAVITAPAGGTPTNVNAGNDDDDVTSFLPEAACLVAQPVTDIEITKNGLGCAPFVLMATPGYLCNWVMTITNIGPDTYHGPLSIKDTTAGATMNSLAAMPACVGSAAEITCTAPVDVTLMSGVPHPYNFQTFYPDGPGVCTASNNASLLQPNPGSPQNPGGNDSDADSQNLPNPPCFAPGTPKLVIEKTAEGCGPDPSSSNWLCEFDITVLNVGSGPQPGPIDIHDFNDKPTTFSGAACAPVGPTVYKCTLPGPIAPLGVVSFSATTTVDPNGVTLADCNVENTVWITNPMTADPGHLSQATQKVPQLFINVGPGPVAVYCDPPSLALSKVSEKTVKSGDGYNVTFRIRADSTGPDPYHGTVELDEVLPEGTTYVDSSWPCVPTTGNDMHCSSPYKDIPVGKYTTMAITIHIPADVARDAKCNVVNTVNAAISAEVLHSDVGVQYTASAAAELPASVCREAPQCPVNQVMPGGGCCDDGTVWNGKQCAKPRPTEPKCPADSHLTGGKCVCDEGTEGKPGSCEPIQSKPVCPDDSHLSGGKCVCDKGTEGKPGRCTAIEEEEPELSCPRDSRIVDGECVCRRGTEGLPGKCRPIEEEEPELSCPKDSRVVGDECVCRRGTEGTPGKCRPIEEDEPEELTCPKDSRVVSGECVCRRGTEGIPGQCTPIQQEEPEVKSCPDDSHFDTRRNSCVCNRPLRGTPGQCVGLQIEEQPQIELTPRQPRLNLQIIR
jgi:hypothetical protein